jgi:outer membrane protein assembly factor BamD
MLTSTRHSLRTLLAAAAMGLLALGCTGQDYDPTTDWSKERLYREAKSALESAQFKQAIDYFEKLEARYPFGPLARQAQLDIAYAYYQYGQYDAAISATDRFIKLHPTQDGIAYAYYLRGLVRYNHSRTFINDVFSRDMEQMDQARLRKTFSDFKRVVTDYPGSEYAEDARQRMVYLRNRMALHELDTARFYFRRSAFTAVVNRVDYLLQNYDRAPAVADALALQARAYERLDLPNQAADVRRVLAANYPDHDAAADPDSRQAPKKKAPPEPPA